MHLTDLGISVSPLPRLLRLQSLSALLLACADVAVPTERVECESGTCVRLATETPTFDPNQSTTHFPNRQHTPRTFTDFAWDVEDAAHVSPETYSQTGDFFIQSTNAGFARFFRQELGFVPQYFLRFAAGLSLEEVDSTDLEDLESFNVPLGAPPDDSFRTLFGFPLDDAFVGRSLFFRTLNQKNPLLPHFCLLTLERAQVTALEGGNQRVEADLRYHCGLAPGEREIRRF